MTVPDIVGGEPRYQPDPGQQAAPLLDAAVLGAAAPTVTVWHLDGVSWADAPPPPRRDHIHTAQTVGWLGLDEIWWCPCNAVHRRGGDGWIRLNPHPRFAEDRACGACGARWSGLRDAECAPVCGTCGTCGTALPDTAAPRPPAPGRHRLGRRR